MTDNVVAVPAKRTLKQRLHAHFAEYGRIAIWTYVVLSVAAIVGFSIAIGVGFSPSSASGVLGVVGAGWVAAKATMPVRILVTLGLTPLIAVVLQRRKAATAAEPDAE